MDYQVNIFLYDRDIAKCKKILHSNNAADSIQPIPSNQQQYNVIFTENKQAKKSQVLYNNSGTMAVNHFFSPGKQKNRLSELFTT